MKNYTTFNALFTDLLIYCTRNNKTLKSLANKSDTFLLSQENADREWKFSRARLWLSFIADDTVLPPPFNILPSLKQIRRTVAYCRKGKHMDESENKKN